MPSVCVVPPTLKTSPPAVVTSASPRSAGTAGIRKAGFQRRPSQRVTSTPSPAPSVPGVPAAQTSLGPVAAPRSGWRRGACRSGKTSSRCPCNATRALRPAPRPRWHDCRPPRRRRRRRRRRATARRPGFRSTAGRPGPAVPPRDKLAVPGVEDAVSVHDLSRVAAYGVRHTRLATVTLSRDAGSPGAASGATCRQVVPSKCRAKGTMAE